VKVKKEEFFSVPNILSYFRIILIPCFIYVYITAKSKNEFLFAAFIILVSGLTDLLDGRIARKYNMITELGKFLDPLADKLTQGAVALCIMFHIRYFLFIFLIMLVKESFMLICNLISIKKFGRKLGGAEWFGKVTTAIVYLAMFVLILFPNLSETIKVSITTGLSLLLVITGVMYIPVFRKLFKDEYKYKHPKFIPRKDQ